MYVKILWRIGDRSNDIQSIRKIEKTYLPPNSDYPSKLINFKTFFLYARYSFILKNLLPFQIDWIMHVLDK